MNRRELTVVILSDAKDLLATLDPLEMVLRFAPDDILVHEPGHEDRPCRHPERADGWHARELRKSQPVDYEACEKCKVRKGHVILS